MVKSLPLINPNQFTIEHSIMLSVSKRIELVTQFNITKRNAGSMYQTTNYGLAGLVEPHNDAWGYEDIKFKNHSKSFTMHFQTWAWEIVSYTYRF